MLNVTNIDTTFSKISLVSGKGAQAQRDEPVARLLAAATETNRSALSALAATKQVGAGVRPAAMGQ